jgi:HPr kinase/phosphorylase
MSEMPSRPDAPALGIPVQRLVEEAELLGLRLQCGTGGLQRVIQNREVQKPGLVLTGLQRPHGDAVHVMGKAEVEYLSVRPKADQRRILMDYVRSGVPCVVLCWGQAPSPILFELAEANDVPLFTSLRTTGDFIRVLHTFLQAELAPREERHGVMVQVHDLGILITGASGIGKSETALELMLRGHRLVADDRVAVARSRTELVGGGVAPLGHFMEVRGLGILHAGDLFGHAAVVEATRLDMVVELVDWKIANEADRTGLDMVETEILGVRLPHIRLPVRPGRNIAMIIEVAARNQILRRRGIHSAQRFDELVMRGLQALETEE